MASCDSEGSSIRSVECPICTEILTDPRILPCGHSICGPQSEDRCLVRLEIEGSIRCPTCRSPHQLRAEDVPPVYGFKDMLESLKKKEMCERHNQEIMFFCHSDQQQFCVMCWAIDHMGDTHKVEPLLSVRQKQVQDLWEKLDLKKLNKLAQAEADIFESQIADLEEALNLLKEEKERKEKQVRDSASLLEKQQTINRLINSGQFNSSCPHSGPSMISGCPYSGPYMIPGQSWQDHKNNEYGNLQEFQQEVEKNEVNGQFCLTESLKLLEKTCSSLSGLLKKRSFDSTQDQKSEASQEPEQDAKQANEGGGRQDMDESSGVSREDSPSVAPFGWTKACILQRIDAKCWWELLYCPQTDLVFFATMTNAVKKYKFDTFTSRLVPEDSYQFTNVLSSIALGPNFSLYLSFRSHAKPNVWQFFTRTRMSEKLKTSTIISVQEDHRLKWKLASYPEKHILLIMASYSGAYSNAVYVFHGNNFIQQIQISVDTKFAHFYPFGLKTGLMGDCHPANETVFYRFEWSSLLQPQDEYQTEVKHFFEVADPNCQLVHISDVTETRRRIMVLGYKESDDDQNVLVGHVLEARKVKQARAEFHSQFELSQSTNFIPFHIISVENGILLGKERLTDEVLLMKLL